MNFETMSGIESRKYFGKKSMRAFQKQYLKNNMNASILEGFHGIARDPTIDIDGEILAV